MKGIIYMILAFFASMWAELKIREVTGPEPEHKEKDDEEKGHKK